MTPKLKIGLIYYSGTGTTAFFSEHIKQILIQEGHVVDSFRYTQNMNIDYTSYDLLGFGCPVWVWNPPRVFRNFLKQEVKKKKIPQIPYFLYNTCGGSPGNTSYELKRVLQKAKGQYLGEMVGKGANNIRAWNPIIGSDKPVMDVLNPQDLEASRLSISNLLTLYADILTNQQKNMQEKGHLEGKAPRKPKFIVLHKFLWLVSTYRWQMRIILGNKTVIEDKCTKCGLCADKICPSGAITLNSDKIPQFNEKKCQGCFGCVNICPTLAIESKPTHNKIALQTYRKNILKL